MKPKDLLSLACIVIKRPSKRQLFCLRKLNLLYELTSLVRCHLRKAKRRGKVRKIDRPDRHMKTKSNSASCVAFWDTEIPQNKHGGWGGGGGRVGIPSSDFGLFNLTQALSRKRVIHTATEYFAPTLSQHSMVTASAVGDKARKKIHEAFR